MFVVKLLNFRQNYLQRLQQTSPNFGYKQDFI